MKQLHSISGAFLLAISLTALSSLTRATELVPQLRVCADPNNLPYSNAKGEGFENKLAEMAAHDFGWTLKYTWWAQRRGFIRNTLKASQCDVIMGTPALEMLAVTRPYYRSGYVFVSRARDNIRVDTFAAPELLNLRIGVQLIGDDGFNSPPAHALGAMNITANVRGFPVYGDYRSDSPSSAIIDAVSNRTIDLAAVWGPMAGYFVNKSREPLHMVKVRGTSSFQPLRFEFAIAIGVRKGDTGLQERFDDFIRRRQSEIDTLLESYGVPRL
jgi:quinoprotein dehydrogenase-associated probable ABC transporter substrate-binding protein